MFVKRNIYNWVDLIIPMIFVVSLPMTFFKMFWLWGALKFIGILISVIAVACFWQDKQSNFKLFFSFFFAFNVLSGFSYLYNGRPFGCFLQDFSDYILPMLFVYIGLFDNRPNRFFFDKMILPTSVMFFLSSICYLTMPSWYIGALVSARNSTWHEQWVRTAEEYSKILRYPAFFQDSYFVSYFSIFCLSIVLFNIFRNDMSKKITYFNFLIILMAVFLCQHRIAWAFSSVLIVLYVVYLIVPKFSKIFKYACISIVFATIAILFVNDNTLNSFSDYGTKVAERFINEKSYSEDFSHRRQAILDNMQYYAFGHGIGSGGSEARRLGFGGVTDCNFVKMFFETGICGSFAFALLIASTFIRAIPNTKYFACEMSIILYILIAMPFSNSLCMYYFISIPFWYAIGRIWNDEYLINAQKLNMRI
jgi:hypothetical protein